MKKNKMMRLASVMLVLTLMSTSVISGTFAKYVSETSASDNARVAKWGVTLAANGLLYSEIYDSYNSGNEGNASYTDITVATYDNTNVVQSVVAPGTINPGTGFSFTLDGRPEVAVALTGEIEAATIVLPEATYVVANQTQTAAGGEETLTKTSEHILEAKYYPVEYTLKKDDTALITDGTMIAVCEKIDDMFTTKAKNTSSTATVTYAYKDTAATAQDYDANTDLGTVIDNTGSNGVYTLTWKWDFENAKDVFDTFLGDLAYEAVGGENGNVIDDTKTVCYFDEGKNKFYSVKAYDLLDDKTGLTEVTAGNLATYGIGITEEFALTVTATQID